MEEAEGGVGRGGSGEDDAEERADVYCAVGKDAGREWRANLRWVLADFPRSQSHRRLVLVLAHVHRPPQRINMSMFTYFISICPRPALPTLIIFRYPSS
jgi:hypothetical protein